ncbi:putative N-acetyltransferase [Trypanosoma cruzi]|uniref:Putative N-acetyltransferase n=1 Tax=Trypanosoma cruzi TaxID=5693 RepID=A0A2V2UZT9_TRYCR|nr:putative N-acetyltransferase [Trypanosoma cruzi]
MNNEHVLVGGSRLRLVPYLAHHVPRYHQWMGDSELMHCTASERLTLEEEYENQRDWLSAEDKLTFVILAPLSIAVNKAVQEQRGNTAFGKNPVVRDVHDDDEGGGETEEVSEVEGGDYAMLMPLRVVLNVRRHGDAHLQRPPARGGRMGLVFWRIFVPRRNRRRSVALVGRTLWLETAISIVLALTRPWS